ncbi:sensor histidine kinase [Roseomonas rosulenta]|uniref:sensor histidine kinase n=1 Tax=Roseomonas rosulenta TaxID=2748667 RepID=UPI001E33AAD7|nr:histidine kinase dimerization/phosphoacceptor domain -containing protein [Roseomonas rosulenta]
MIQGGPIEAARPPALRRLLTGVRGRLVFLVGVSMVPVIGIAGAQAWHDYASDLTATRQAAQALQEQASAEHRAVLDMVEEMLLSLARGAGLSPMACEETLRAAQAVFPRRIASVWILDQDGRPRCGAPPGAERGEAGLGLPPFRGEARLVLGGFEMDAASGVALMPAAVPIPPADDAPRGVIGATIRLVQPVPEAQIAGPHRIWLLDRVGTTFALTPATEADLPVGEPPVGGAGPFEAAARSGEAHAWSVGTVRPGLRLMVGVPMDDVRRAALGALRQRLIEIVGFVLACLVVVLIGVELSVARPLRRLALQVRGWSPREPYAAIRGSHDPAEMKDLDTALLAASGAIAQRETALQATLKQRDLAIEEMHHRVHNNLQIVASLLGMQAENSRQAEVKAELALTRYRVRALATLYRHLSRATQPGRIRLRPFIEELCQQLREHAGSSRDGQVTMKVEVEDIDLEADQADSLTLLITEAVSNAVQHAFPDGRAGTILVSLRRDGANAELVVADDGIGLPPDADRTDALGLALIQGFASHLGGTAVITGDGGTRISVAFPLERA